MRRIQASVSISPLNYAPSKHIYVDAGVVETGNGTLTLPFKTISEAVTASNADSIICVYPGTYTEDVVITGRHNIVCPTHLASPISYPATESGYWPIIINGNITVNFTTPTKIGIQDVLANDIIINCTTPGPTNSLQLRRCWVRDIIVSQNANIRIQGSAPSFAGNVDSVVRSVLGGSANVECIFSYWGLGADGSFATVPSSVNSFQLIESRIYGTPQTVIQSITYSSVINSTGETGTGLGIPNIEFMTTDKALTIIGWATPFTVSGTNAFIDSSGIPWSNDISDRAFNMVIGTGVPNRLGFFDRHSLPISKPSVTGSRVGGLALANLLSAMNSLGLLTDNSTDIVEGGSVMQVDDFSALIALTNVFIGQKVRVSSVGRSYEFTSPGVSISDGISVLDTATGQWHSLDGTSDQKWRDQLTWSIDPVNGNDEASGLDDDNAVKTSDEIQRRWGTGRPKITASSVTIRILGDGYQQAIDNFSLIAEPGSANCTLSIIGVPINIANTTISSYLKYSHITPEATIISTTDITDWTPFIGARLRSGPSSNLISWVAKINPAGGGNNTARVSVFGSQGTTGSRLWIQTDPSLGNALFIESLPLVHQFNIDFRGAGSSNGVQVSVQDLSFDGEVSIIANEGVRTRVYACAFLSGSLENIQDSSSGGFSRIHSCYMNNTQRSDKIYHVGCCYINNIFTGSESASNIYNGLFQDCGISILGRHTTNIYDTQIFSSTTDLIKSLTGSIIVLSNCSGNTTAANSVGIELAQGTIIETSGVINLLAQFGVEINIRGFSKIYGEGSFHWSDVPANGIKIGKWFGTGTLTEGSGLVTVYPIISDLFVNPDIKIGYLIPKTGAPQLGYGSVTGSGFTVNNGDMTDNTSTFWYSVESAIPRNNSILPLSIS